LNTKIIDLVDDLERDLGIEISTDLRPSIEDNQEELKSKISAIVDVVLADLLSQDGFDENWNPTPVGLRIERWIDRLQFYRFHLQDAFCSDLE
jgi:hypothetical protein